MDENTAVAVEAPAKRRGRPPKARAEALAAIRQAAAENGGTAATARKRRKEPRPTRTLRPEVAEDDVPERGTDGAVLQCLINSGIVTDEQVAAARLLSA